MAIVSSKSFELVNAKTKRNKGPLVTVEIAPGRHAKMYRKDAEAQGLIKPLTVHVDAQQGLGREGGEKSRPAGGNKMRPPSEDKGQDPPAPVAPPERADGNADDFTTIDGVGPATARALAAAGITTFEQLRTAALGDGLSKVVSGNAQASIETWLEDGGG